MVEAPVRTARRQSRKLRALRYDAGSMALNLVCTVGRRGERSIERLRGPEEMAAWLQHHELSLPGAALDDEFLASTRLLREALHDFLRALVDGEPPAPDAVELINKHAGTPVPGMRIVREVGATGPGVVARRENELGPGQVLALIAQDGIAHLQDEDRLERLSACVASDCRMLYLNATPGARRQWCSMSYCGNRMKAANHRARRQPSPTQAPASLEP